MKKYALAALIAVAAAIPAHAQNAKPQGPTMAIRGAGEYSIKPDYATIYLTVTNRSRNTDATIEAHARQIEKARAVLETLRTQGVEIKKSNFVLKTEQKTRQVIVPGRLPEQRPIGPAEFIAHTTYQLTTRKLDSLSELVGRLASSEVFEISSVSYDVDHPRSALLEARKAAVTDAREQAEAYASAAKIQLIEVEEITDGEASRYSSGYGEADLPSRRAAAAGGAWLKVTQIVPPASLNYRASVNIVWRISSKP